MALVRELARRLTADGARERERAADQAGDRPARHSPEDGRLLVRVLAEAAAREPDHAALESQLHALLQLVSFADAASLAPLRAIDAEALPGALPEYLTDLLAED
ncbi:hypothetical protein [Streptomyces sp. NPDC097619]|uniref:hypothetical protein n=1 Tax=Streptomyces sp. NPDC097619 TaxID=3157228 RepID=UPI00331A9FBA